MTTEDKARVFGLYIGSMCQRFLVDHNVPSGEDDKIQLDHINFRSLVDGNGEWYYKLILKDLSEITDEDARGVAKIYYDADAASWQQGQGIVRLLTQEPYIKLVNPRFDKITDIVDFLRSRSYMLPYRGINLFESGIAVKKEEGK